MTDEREQHTWLSNTLRQPPAGADGGCVDAETLAAWVDGDLGAKAAGAVELHVSNCPQCVAVLAAMERSAPPAPARPSWTRARLFRWLVPLTAAATAVVIWIAVPDRTVTSDRAQDLKSASTQPAVSIPAPVPFPVPEAAPVPGPAPGRETAKAQPRITNAEPGTTNRELGTRNVERDAQFEDELRRETAAQKSLGAAAGAAADAAGAPEAPPAPTAAAPPPAADPVPPAATQRAASAARADPAPSVDTLNEAVKLKPDRFAANQRALSTESTSPASPLYRWRVVASRIERSINGGKTWTRTRVPPGSPSVIRSVDADRAVVRTSDSAEFYTIDGGRSWTRVQENSAAPF